MRRIGDRVRSFDPADRERSRRRPRRRVFGVVWLCAALLLPPLLGSGCRTRPLGESPVRGVRVSDAIDQGDAARRASVRLVLQGLDADEAGEFRRAQGSYERAIQVDPTNPYAYLALARHNLDGGSPGDASNLIDQAAALFEADGFASPEVDVHLIGLRGWDLESRRRPGEASLYLDRAAALDPVLWEDGYLSARELR